MLRIRCTAVEVPGASNDQVPEKRPLLAQPWLLAACRLESGRENAVSCQCEYGQCNQSQGCPVRSTPLPSACLKAKQCLSDDATCPCESAIKADEPLMLPLSAVDHGFIWGIVICLSMALMYAVTALGQWITHSGVLERIDALASRFLELVPYLPGLPYF